MYAKKTLMAGAMAAALLSIGVAQAAESIKTDDIKVTATRVEKNLSDVNMSVTVVTAEDIKHSPARNVGELLENIPGIRILNDGSQGMKRVSIRGENGFRSLIMIDGQRTAEHKSMSGTPMLVDVSSIERIEVIKGPASVLYGSDAIGGVVNIITKKGGTKAFQGSVSGGYNSSADGVSASANIAGSANGWNYRLGFGYEDHGDLDTPAGKMENTDFNSKAANAFLSYDITPEMTLGGTLDVYDMEFHSSSIEYRPKGFTVDVDEWKRSKVALFGEMRNVNDALQRIRADVFYQVSDKTMLNKIPNQMGPFIMFITPMSDNELTQTGLSLQTDWQLGDRNYLVVGYEYSKEDLDAKSPFGHILPRPIGDGTQSIVSNKSFDGSQELHAVFASMETEIIDDLTVNYGVRYTNVDTDMLEVKTQGKGAGQRKYNDKSDDKAIFNAGVLYSGIDNLTLRANYSQGYRHPLLQDLYIDSSMGKVGKTLANPELKPETSDNFELGLRWKTNGLDVDASLFYNMADNFITARDVWVKKEVNGQVYETPAYSQNQNLAKATTYGLELSASLDMQNGFEPYASVTAMRRQTEDNYGWKTYDSGTPEFQARYGVRWAGETNGMKVRWDMYGVTASETVTSTRSKETTEIPVAAGTRHPGGDSNKVEVATGKWVTETRRHSGYTTFNITAGLDFGAEGQYSLDAGLYNIFDKEYQLSSSIIEPGRHAAIKFNAAF